MHNYIISKWSLYLLPSSIHSYTGYILCAFSYVWIHLPFQRWTVVTNEEQLTIIFQFSQRERGQPLGREMLVTEDALCVSFIWLINAMYCHSCIKLMNAFWASLTLMLLSYMAFLFCWCNNYNLLKLFHFAFNKAVAFQWTKWEEFLFVLKFP